MQWTKSPKEIVDKFDAALAAFPTAERRMMFGSPAAFVNGNMFAGVHQQYMIFRLPDQPREEFLKIQNAQVFEPMPGRPMREYVVAPPSITDDAVQIEAWLARAIEYASSLPPKEKKPRTVSKKTTNRR
jgi:TfoX/Sxy family transcriptional regulator of competence genes